MNYDLGSDWFSCFEKTSKSFLFIDMRTKALDLGVCVLLLLFISTNFMHFMPTELLSNFFQFY